MQRQANNLCSSVIQFVSTSRRIQVDPLKCMWHERIIDIVIISSDPVTRNGIIPDPFSGHDWINEGNSTEGRDSSTRNNGRGRRKVIISKSIYHFPKEEEAENRWIRRKDREWITMGRWLHNYYQSKSNAGPDPDVGIWIFNLRGIKLWPSKGIIKKSNLACTQKRLFNTI